MADVVVKPVASRGERKQFLQLPWELYRNDPNWIPPLLMNQKELLGYKHHPFYDDAEIQTFLAMQDGRPVGRIAAIVNHAHNRRHSERRGFFGFFESIDDGQVAAALFDAARRWFAERDIHQLRGPCNPSLNYECGLLVEGFDSAPFFMMTHNLPYYGRLIESCGFAKTQDLLAFYGNRDMIAHLDKKLAYIADQAVQRFNIVIRKLNRKRFVEDVRTFLQLYNDSLGATWGFVPLSEGEIQHLAKSMRFLIEPDLAVFAEVDGKPIGAAFGLLDYNPRIKEMNGRLLPLGFLKLITGHRQLKRMRVLSTNVIPEYQRWGVGLSLADEIKRQVIEWELDHIEFSWVLESNQLSRRTLEKGGAHLYKRYRLYDSMDAQ